MDLWPTRSEIWGLNVQHDDPTEWKASLYRNRTFHSWPQRYQGGVGVSKNGRVQSQFAYKGFEGKLWPIQNLKSTTFISLTWLSKSMPPVINGFYRLQFGLAFPPNSNLPKPKPLYLTNNGEGKQLTVEEQTDSNQHNQEVNKYGKCVVHLSANMFLRRSGRSCHR